MMLRNGGLGARVERLSPEQRRLLEQRLRPAGPAPESDRIAPRPGGGPAPLSFAQERLWAFQRANPASALHNVYHAVRLTGDLEVAALGRALAEVVRRHEALRTRFILRDGRPVALGDGIAPALPVLDLQAAPAGCREALALQAATGLACPPFDLERGPLLRTALACLRADEHILLLAVHHILIDGWSLGLLVRELAALYDSFSGGVAAGLAEPPVQYGDFALWQRRQVEKGSLSAARAYWRGQLAGAPRLFARRPWRGGLRGAACSALLPTAEAEALRNLGRRQRSTLFIILLAAFKALLFRATGCDDLVVSSPAAYRDREEIQGAVGLFLNTLPLRTRLDRGMSFLDLLARVRETALTAFVHQAFPFEVLLCDLGMEPSGDPAPYLEVAFNMPKAGASAEEPLRLARLAMQPVLTSEIGSESALVFYAVEEPAAVRLHFGYDDALFPPATVGAWMASFQTLLRTVGTEPETRLADLPYGSPANPFDALATTLEPGPPRGVEPQR